MLYSNLPLPGLRTPRRWLRPDRAHTTRTTRTPPPSCPCSRWTGRPSSSRRTCCPWPPWASSPGWPGLSSREFVCCRDIPSLCNISSVSEPPPPPQPPPPRRQPPPPPPPSVRWILKTVFFIRNLECHVQTRQILDKYKFYTTINSNFALLFSRHARTSCWISFPASQRLGILRGKAQRNFADGTD